MWEKDYVGLSNSTPLRRGHGNPVSSTNPSHTSVERAPRDPPGNTFGVAHGVVVAATSTSLALGRAMGSGIVCLLLRPYVQMSALGLGSGTASVSSGNAGYSVPNAPVVPGHAVIDARYAVNGCVMPLIPKGPVPPCRVTAVIDFAGVGPFCPDMLGPTVAVHAWVAATKYLTSTTPLQAVDPQNFLYDDAWGHM